MNDSASSSTQPSSTQNVVLIGFMGCGKSSVARRLSVLLGWPLIDLDAQIEQIVGTSIQQFFASHGEDAFRELETAQLRQTLHQTAIIATGGGIVTRPQNRELLCQSREEGATCIVFLRAQPETLATRIRRQPGVRPLIDGNCMLDWQETRDRVAFLLEQRAAWYEECADLIVDSDELSSHQVAQIVAAFIAPENTSR